MNKWGIWSVLKLAGPIPNILKYTLNLDPFVNVSQPVLKQSVDHTTLASNFGK